MRRVSATRGWVTHLRWFLVTEVQWVGCIFSSQHIQRVSIHIWPPPGLPLICSPMRRVLGKMAREQHPVVIRFTGLDNDFLLGSKPGHWILWVSVAPCANFGSLWIIYVYSTGPFWFSRISNFLEFSRIQSKPLSNFFEFSRIQCPDFCLSMPGVCLNCVLRCEIITSGNFTYWGRYQACLHSNGHIWRWRAKSQMEEGDAVSLIVQREWHDLPAFDLELGYTTYFHTVQILTFWSKELLTYPSYGLCWIVGTRDN